MFLFLLGLYKDPAFADETVTHESIWTSGFTQQKQSFAAEVSIGKSTIESRTNDGQLHTHPYLLLPDIHLRYGILDRTEVFIHATTPKVLALGLKQQIYEGADIPIGLQTQVGYTLEGQLFSSIGGEYRSTFIHSGFEVMGSGKNFLDEDTRRYLIQIRTGHEIPLATIKDTVKPFVVVQYTRPLLNRNHELEKGINREGYNVDSTDNVLYLMYDAMSAGLHFNVNNTLSIYTLLNTYPNFGEAIAKEGIQTQTVTLHPWAKTTDRRDIVSNSGFKLMVSSVF